MTQDKVKNYFMAKKGYKLVNGNGFDLVEKYQKLGHNVTVFCAKYLIYKVKTK